MVSQLESPNKPEIIYPERDGNPMSDNTVQFRWITTIKSNLDWLFTEDEQVFVAGDLLWYPIENNNKKRQAPDVMVVFGRPKGDRGSYQQWKENNIAPQVVFEILSPGNTQTEMNRKLLFYEHHGVEEYYIYDPDKNDFSGLLRKGETLEVIEKIDLWVSPRLGIRFQLAEPELIIYYPDGQPFSSFTEERQRAENERQRAENERQRAENEHQRAENEHQRAEQLAAKLRELGINPEEI
ncbi:Uma2 family endonuclease [Crocosphaera sp. XPORK-15E]|uniref:Uma2 family endonuclease n=1 Tax=Crocosphaera sp. XPORK-15E TaxID=3110247 RepID=UPI002B211742|nr:Uma2 family endonuclease [Crocosphaera sp. XPORK-15E]MEA5536197.1 Uma2 family endonuclease [Crocosphaera sp. XPORK-15E]